jgi:hypothetical protein
MVFFRGLRRAFVVEEESSSDEDEKYEQEFGSCWGGPQGSMLSAQGSMLSAQGSMLSHAESFAQGSVLSTADSFAIKTVFDHGHALAAPTMSAPMIRSGPYQARADDPVDLKVADFFRNFPDAYRKCSSLTRVRPGVYLLHGRMLEVELQNNAPGYLGQAQAPSTLMVKDGPLRQMFADYIENKEDDTAQYSGSVFQTKNAVSNIPQMCRMTFHDTGSDYTRKEAMMVAKEQAMVREKAATMMKDGQVPTEDLKKKYAKSITMKLGKNQHFEDAISFAQLAPNDLMYASLPSQYLGGPPQAQSMLIRSYSHF